MNYLNTIIKKNRNLKRLMLDELIDFKGLTLNPFTPKESPLIGFYCKDQKEIEFAGCLFRNCLRKDSRNCSGRVFFFVSTDFRPIGVLDPINSTYFNFSNQSMNVENLKDCLNLIEHNPIEDYLQYKKECEDERKSIRSNLTRHYNAFWQNENLIDLDLSMPVANFHQGLPANLARNNADISLINDFGIFYDIANQAFIESGLPFNPAHLTFNSTMDQDINRGLIYTLNCSYMVDMPILGTRRYQTTFMIDVGTLSLRGNPLDTSRIIQTQIEIGLYENLRDLTLRILNDAEDLISGDHITFI